MKSLIAAILLLFGMAMTAAGCLVAVDIVVQLSKLTSGEAFLFIIIFGLFAIAAIWMMLAIGVFSIIGALALARENEGIQSEDGSEGGSGSNENSNGPNDIKYTGMKCQSCGRRFYPDNSRNKPWLCQSCENGRA